MFGLSEYGDTNIQKVGYGISGSTQRFGYSTPLLIGVTKSLRTIYTRLTWSMETIGDTAVG